MEKPACPVTLARVFRIYVRCIPFVAYVLLTLPCAAALAQPPAHAPSEADRERLEALGYEPWVKDAEPATETGVITHDRRRTAPGYLLFANRGSCNAKLIDNSGKVHHTWQGPVQGFWSDVELMPDGDLYVVGATDDEFANQLTARYLRRLSWDSTVEWQSEFPAHHDIERVPGGKLLALSSVERFTDLHGPARAVIDDQVILLDERGKTLEEHSLFDLFVGSPKAVKFGSYSRVERRNGRAVLDLFHANSVEWVRAGKRAGKHPIYRDGNILVCLRHQNMVVVIDRKKRQIVWSWGASELQGPHSARMLANGNVMVFDNGLRRRHSRILEIDPRGDRVVWRYEPNDAKQFFTPYGGSLQPLANGNVFLAETRRGRMLEVDRQGQVVWAYVNPSEDLQQQRRATIHAAKRLAPSYVAP
ncbi:MAG TPA: aryl-sulfate sulfotransferase, partial [Terriglobales bacterium]|nr:aryl-sulfate sulfotransferase [Terriglobales bacterium]